MFARESKQTHTPYLSTRRVMHFIHRVHMYPNSLRVPSEGGGMVTRASQIHTPEHESTIHSPPPSTSPH